MAATLSSVTARGSPSPVALSNAAWPWRQASLPDSSLGGVQEHDAESSLSCLSSRHLWDDVGVRVVTERKMQWANVCSSRRYVRHYAPTGRQSLMTLTGRIKISQKCWTFRMPGLVPIGPSAITWEGGMGGGNPRRVDAAHRWHAR